MTTVEVTDIVNFILSPPSSSLTAGIHIPVLLADGTSDSLYCGQGALDCSDVSAVMANETPYYPHVSRLDYLPVPLAGHAVNLHYPAPFWFAAANLWISTLH